MNHSFVRVTGLLCCLLAATALWAEETAAPAATAAPAVAKTPAPSAPIVVSAYAIPTDHSGSQVNWATGQLEVVGVGYATAKTEIAKRQAYTTAMIIMIEEAKRALATFPIDATTVVAPSSKDAAGMAIVNSVLANLVTIDERWDGGSGTYAVVGALPMFGERGLVPLVVKNLGTPKPVEMPIDKLALISPIPRGHTPQRYAAPYTGVIINADAVPIKACLYPHLLRFDGVECWGPAALKPEQLAAGPVRYARNVEEAINLKLAGSAPMILQAIGTGQGYYPAINVDDVFLVLHEHKYTALLDHLPLVITLGQPSEVKAPEKTSSCARKH
ncbi:MAG: hypothetical protein ACYC7E_14645 [Armatimonadota bacterium]